MRSPYAVFRPGHVIEPKLDPIDPDRRLDPDAPLMHAWLGGRPVVLARVDPRTQPAHLPAQMTVPITVSRLRRAIDIERDRATGPYVPSLVDDWPLSHMPIGSTDAAGTGRWVLAVGLVAAVACVAARSRGG